MIDFSNLIPFFESELKTSGVFGQVMQILISISPILLAIVLFTIFWPLWVNYVRSSWIFSLKYALLEIKLPKDIFKSPRAMELVLNALHNTSDGNKLAQYWKGEKRPSYSLEIISVEGVVKFYIYTEDRRKNGVMSALYAQFPGIEVAQVEDYARPFHFDPNETKLGGLEFEYTKPDVYPLRTYVDYGLDKDPKEEFKVDPMVPMIEFLANVGANQQIWFQFIIRAHIKDQVKPGTWWTLNDNFKDEGQKVINEIMKRDPKTKLHVDTEAAQLAGLSEGEKNLIEAIDRKASKTLFDVGIRVIYIARKDLYDKPNGVGGIISSFKHFNIENMNGLKPNGKRWSSKLVGSPWEDYKGIRAKMISTAVLDAYKRRCYFYEPFPFDKPLVMNVEELATIYHFPGQVAGTPNLNRVASKKSEAPANLPI